MVCEDHLPNQGSGYLPREPTIRQVRWFYNPTAGVVCFLQPKPQVAKLVLKERDVSNIRSLPLRTAKGKRT